MAHHWLVDRKCDHWLVDNKCVKNYGVMTCTLILTKRDFDLDFGDHNTTLRHEHKLCELQSRSNIAIRNHDLTQI